VLSAQAPRRGVEVPVVPGSTPDTAAQRRAGSTERYLRMYSNESSIEAIFAWYQHHLNASPADTAWHADSVPDVPPGGETPIKWRITFHKFDDECMSPPPDSAHPASDVDRRTCRKVRRGDDKRNALDLSRVGYKRGGYWIEDATFIWYVREGAGGITRLEVELRDTGLRPDWKYYEPRGEIIISAADIPSR
jgi:hypothetical protein